MKPEETDMSEQEGSPQRPPDPDAGQEEPSLWDVYWDRLRRQQVDDPVEEADLLAGLNASKRSQLISLLQRVAESQGLIAGVHPNLDAR